MMHSSRMSPFQNKRNRQILQRDDTLNLSPILNDTSIFKSLNDTSLRQALDESSIFAGGTAGSGLNESYFEIIQTCKYTDVSEVLSRLSIICLDALESIDPWKRYNAENYWLAEEANTWKLILCLYSDSIKEYSISLDSLHSESLSQHNYVDLFLQGNAEVRLLGLLVNWLEYCAAYQEASTRTSAPVTGNFHWGNTLHQLLTGTALFNKEKNKSMITCMDPDAPKRQKKVPHSDDQTEDDQLCKRIFTEIRCGKYEDAISLCVNAGQPWRAAVLQGSRLIHYQQKEGGTLISYGNASRDLWKWCSLGIVNDITENIYYRATLGVLCGHLQSTLAACHGNWKDLLWAHLKVQIQIRVDKFLHEHHATAHANTTQSQVLELLEKDHHTEEMPLGKIFNCIHALMDGKKESLYQKCQRSLMLGEVRTIMQDSLEDIEAADEKLVRFLAHLILILRHIGKEPDHEIGNQIIEKYVTQLIEEVADGSIDCANLVAYYTSTVGADSQIKLYSNLMDHIDKHECRNDVVEAGHRADIDIAAAARMSIKKVIIDIQVNYGKFDTIIKVTTLDKNEPLIAKALSSLEWLALTSVSLVDSLWLSNAMVRTFLFLNNSEAASSVLVRFNELFPTITAEVRYNSTELREHLCLKAYLDALENYAVWLRHFESGQPKEVVPLPSDATFSDKVLYEQQLAQYELQKKRWQNAIATMSRETREMLYNVLLFSEGWLVNSIDSTISTTFTHEEKQEREKEMETLRQKCIPEVVILLLKILQSQNDVDSHKEALKLSEIIADDNRCLYEVFSKVKLAEILERLKMSSLYLLQNGLDMFGCEWSED